MRSFPGSSKSIARVVHPQWLPYHPNWIPGHQKKKHLHCTAPINLPVLPPMLPSAPPTLERADPADEVTLLKPCEAFDCASEAFSLAALATSDGFVEALRTPARRTANLECRSTARDAARDIVTEEEGGRGVEVDVVRLGVGRAPATLR